jgi:2-hydroxycyclohexanecarboxyl-CoA dehydrogenase
MMDLNLQGKTALVTGTGSQIGFGKGIALKLAEEGCDVICSDIDIEGAEQTSGEVKTLGRRSIGLKMDITERKDVNSAIEKALKEFDHIDILVNTAGRSSGLRPFTDSTQDNWDMDININLRGTMNVTQALLPHMLERSYGKIVNFSTHAAHQPTGLAGAAVYIAAKSGTVMFSKTLAGEVGYRGININVIAPGAGNTNFHRISAHGNNSMVDLVENMAKAGKTTTPEDIGNTVAFLVSDISNKLSGQVLEVSAPSEPRG